MTTGIQSVYGPADHTFKHASCEFTLSGGCPFFLILLANFAQVKISDRMVERYRTGRREFIEKTMSPINQVLSLHLPYLTYALAVFVTRSVWGFPGHAVTIIFWIK